MFNVMKQDTTTKVPVIQTLGYLKSYPRWVCLNRKGQLISPITGQEATTHHPQSWGDVSNELPDMVPNTIRMTLQRMAKDGQIEQTARGMHCVTASCDRAR